MNARTFTLDIEPLSMQNELKFGKFGSYTTARKKKYLDDIAFLAKQHRPPKPFEGAVSLGLTCVLKRPSDFPKLPEGWVPHWKRPDSTNLLKAIEDALSLVGFWHDDGQIADTIVRKRYGGVGEKPKIIVTIEKL
jgi:Holliday junction resolvase RusA-like endonuclease